MRKEIIIALIVAIFLSLGLGQEFEVNESEEPEPSQDFAVCGDGICQPELQGVCPEDCEDNGSETENNNRSSEEEQSNNNNLVALVVSGSFGILIFVITAILYFKKRSQKSESPKKEQRNRELERALRKRFRQGYNYKQIEKELLGQGYRKEDINSSLQYISDDLINR